MNVEEGAFAGAWPNELPCIAFFEGLVSTTADAATSFFVFHSSQQFFRFVSFRFVFF